MSDLPSPEQCIACHELCDFLLTSGAIAKIESLIPEAYGAALQTPALTATFKGQVVRGSSARLYVPSPHSLGGTRYDAEWVLQLDNLNVAVLLVARNRPSASQRFFHAFLGKFVNAGDPIVLSEGVDAAQSLPSEGSFYTYAGVDTDGKTPKNWVVFRHPVNIHPDDLGVVAERSEGRVPPQVSLPKKVYYNANPDVSTETWEANAANAGPGKMYIDCDQAEAAEPGGLKPTDGSALQEMLAPAPKPGMFTQAVGAQLRSANAAAYEFGYLNLLLVLVNLCVGGAVLYGFRTAGTYAGAYGTGLLRRILPIL